MRILTRLVAGCLLATFLAAGCKSLDQRALDRSADAAVNHAEQAEVELRTGKVAAAVSHWREASNALRPGSDDYLLGKLYLAHSRFESSIGWAHLLAGEPQLAGQAYRNSIATMRDGLRSHKAILRDNKEQAELLLNMAQAAVYGASTYMHGRNAAIRGNYFQPTYVPIPDWIRLPEPAVRLPGASIASGGLQHHVVRIPVVPDRGPLKRVGRVVIKGQGHCTGSLVGPRVVLTNAHCVVRGQDPDAPLHPSELSFRLEKVRYSVSFPVRTFFTHHGERAGYRSVKGGTLNERYANDWALLVIDTPPGMRLGYLSLDAGLAPDSSWRRDDRLVLAGYSGDLNDGHFMTMHWGCEPLRITSVISYDCSSAPGSSGSPLFRISDGRWRVVAVHACGNRARSPAAQHSCGPHIRQVIPEIARLRTAYPYPS